MYCRQFKFIIVFKLLTYSSYFIRVMYTAYVALSGRSPERVRWPTSDSSPAKCTDALQQTQDESHIKDANYWLSHHIWSWSISIKVVTGKWSEQTHRCQQDWEKEAGIRAQWQKKAPVVCILKRWIFKMQRCGSSLSMCDHLAHYRSRCLLPAFCSLVHFPANLISLLRGG